MYAIRSYYVEQVCHNPRHGIAEPILVALHEYLNAGFALHIRDEEEDFLPVVERRAAPQENMRKLHAQLAHEHEVDLKIARDLAGEIDCLSKHRAFRDPVITSYSIHYTKLYDMGSSTH